MAGHSTEMIPVFHYPPIGRGQIRILQLDPGENNDVLSGQLITTHLVKKPSIEYDALSYMWEDPTPTNTIWLSGKPLPIARNLNSALTQLRCDTPLLIWIDAVCIDQTNDVELAEQVQLMRRLYRGARLVRIWINEPGLDESSEAVVALQNFPQYEVDRFSRNVDAMLRRLGEDPAFWTPVLPLFTNSYWSRAWIQQEVLNASAFDLYCGNIVIPGRSFARFKQNVSWLHSIAVYSLRMTRLQGWLETCKIIGWIGPVSDMNSNHRRFRYLEDLLRCTVACSKPQDHIYAIMHLAEDYEEGGIIVDYSKSDYEVAVDTAAYLVRKYRKVEFLKNAYLRVPRLYGQKGRRSDEITWTPRYWCGYREPRGLSPGVYLTVATSCAPDAVETAERILRLRGFRMDRADVCLTKGIDSAYPTLNQFWTSPLGQILKEYANDGTPDLPIEMFKVLVQWNLVTESIFGEKLDTMRATKYELLSVPEPVVAQQSEGHLGRVLYEATIRALKVLLRLADDPENWHERLFEDIEPHPVMFKDVDELTMVALGYIFRELSNSMIVMTEEGRLAHIPECDIQPGDEVWIVLGCDVPIVLRPLPNSRYWHICGAMVPTIQDHEVLDYLSSDLVPGDQVGDWIVEDIEVE